MRRHLALFFAIFFVACCCSDAPEHYIVSDVISNFDIAIKEMFPASIEIKEGVYDRKLITGWYPIRSNNVLFAAGEASELRFFSLDKAPLILSLRCRPVRPPEGVQQVISLFLNSTPIATLSLNPGWSEHEIALPSPALKLGENTLRFEYGYAAQAPGAPDNPNRRVLSVAFSDISFTEPESSDVPTLHKVDGRILQSPGSTLVYYSTVPGSGRLQVRIDEMGKQTEAHVFVESDNQESVDVVLSRSGPAWIDLAGFAGEIVRLTFHAKSKSGDEEPIVWSEIQIVDLDGGEKSTGSKDEEALGEDHKKLSDQNYDVFYVVLDAFYAKHASLYGYSRQTTPFLEELAQEAIVFSNFFAHSPYTLASTGTLLTSKYPHQHGLTRTAAVLRPDLGSLPGILSGHAVESYLISDHTFLVSDEWGLARDFSEVIKKGSYRNSLDEVVDAVSALYKEANDENRKFVYLHLIPPHRPYDPPEELKIFDSPGNEIDLTGPFLDDIEKGNYTPSQKELEYIAGMYDANVLYADTLVKEIVEFLEGRGLWDKTIFIVTSDHGESVRMEHGKLGHNTTLFDEMIHIPFVVRLPDHLELQNKTIESVSGIVDVAPTLLDLFGITTEEGFKGRSLLSDMFGRGRPSSEKYVFLENPGSKQVGVRDQEHKYIASPEHRMLFELRTDPEERVNIYSAKPIAAGYYEQWVAKEYAPQSEPQEDRVRLDQLSEEQRKKLRELGYIR